MAIDAIGLDRGPPPAERSVEVNIGAEHQLAGVSGAAVLAAIERGGRLAGVSQLGSEDITRVGSYGQ